MFDISQPVYNGAMPKPKIKVKNGYMLYALFLPVIGLFLERYAVSALVAIILWSLILILMPVVLLTDKKNLNKENVNTETLGNSFLLPPLYIFKRQALVGGETMLCVASVTLIIGAILTNGFIKGLRINTTNVNEMVPNSSVTQLDNFSGNTKYTIDECVKAYSSTDVNWSTEKKVYGFEITAQGKHSSKDFTIIIKLEFDGFTYHDFRITDVKINGESLDTDGKKDFYKAVFLDYQDRF